AVTSRDPALADVTLRSLAQLGVNFSKSFGQRPEFQLQLNQTHILCRDGIAFTGGRNKGHVLLSLLMQQDLALDSRAIVFVDNDPQRKHHRAVADAVLQSTSVLS